MGAFVRWRDIVQRYPQWTQYHIDRLERSGGEAPTLWWCREEPLPRADWISIETKGYTDSSWSPLPATARAHLVVTPDGTAIPDTLGVVIQGRTYLSRRGQRPNGRTAYNLLTLDA
jgi:hypothetical protein